MKKQFTTTEARKPTHRIYAVTGKGKKSTWTPIGACWPHKDGKGFSLENSSGLAGIVQLIGIT